MRAMFDSYQFSDESGNPYGGCTFGTGFTISWQRGPLGRDGERQKPNGAFVEDIISAAKDRIEFYQKSKFACEENAAAIEHLEAALGFLHQRTMKREYRKVEGTMEV